MFKNKLEEAEYNIDLIQSTLDEAIDIIELLCQSRDDEFHYHAYVTAAEFLQRIRPPKIEQPQEKPTHCGICGTSLDPVFGCTAIDCIPF